MLQHFKSLVNHHGGSILWDIAGHCLVLLNVKFFVWYAVANYNTKIAGKKKLCFIYSPDGGLLCVNKAETLSISGLYGKNTVCWEGGKSSRQLCLTTVGGREG